jgi:hypothetical protein
MAFNIPGLPFKLTAADMGGVDLSKSILGGLQNYNQFQQARYAPQMMEAQVNELKGRAQKNMMMSKLFESLMGGGGMGGEAGGMEEPQGGGIGGGNNMKAAILKAFTGIDPFLMSPQQEQALKLQGNVQQLANKKNIETGGANVVRENLQDVVSFPKEYVDIGGHFKMLKDIAASKLGDKEARERLIQAATANKFKPEYATAQLGAFGKTNPGEATLKHQEAAITQGWPAYADKIIQNLPGDIQKEAERRHNQGVKNISKTRSEYYSSGGKQTKETPSSDREMSVNINEEAHRLNVPAKYIMEDAKFFQTSPENIIAALDAGVKTEKEMLDWIKGLKK